MKLHWCVPPVALLLACGFTLSAQVKATPRARLTPGPRGVPNQQAALQWAASVDAGDHYRTPQGVRSLRRLPDAIAVATDSTTPEFREQLLAPGRPLAGYVPGQPGAKAVTVLARPQEGKRRGIAKAEALAALLQSVRANAAGRSANPVFIDAQTGLRQIATTELIVGLKPGSDARAYFGVDWPRVAPVWGAPDQFVLTLPNATAEEVFAAVGRHLDRSEVAWAEPNFITQIARAFIPNDPLFTNQWHLLNTGQFGGKPGADAHLTGAWDLTLGSSNVVVALVDDGLQLNHPELAANLYTNPGEIPDNGLDDDGNGFIDDVHGWDFFAHDNDPSPAHVDDNHGTALAGVLAALGNNGVGVIGAAPRSRILPLKIIAGDDGIPVTEISRVLYYAAGLNLQGQRVWRGADVISISLIFAKSFVVDAALNTAATQGRGGLGCPIFCASGNSAAAWVPFEIEFEEAGNYTLRWQFSKDVNDVFAVGANTVWVDNVIFPDGTYEGFEQGLAAEWVSGGASAWRIVTDGVNGNHAVTGWDGPGSHSLRAGPLQDNQTNWIELTTFVNAGSLRFSAWVESEAGSEQGQLVGYDIFSFLVNGVEVDFDAGVPVLETDIGYPANHPAAIAVGASTDFDFRADYSQFGPSLDFVAPSDGGAVSITTTDRTGADGYNNTPGAAGNYAYDFGGTSSATPLAAGIAALALAVNPHLPVADLRALMRGTCDHIGGVFYNEDGFSPIYGYGRLNAERAISRARPNLLVSIAASPNPVVVGDPLTYTVSVRNNATSLAGPVSVTNRLPAGVSLGSVVPPPSARSGDDLIWNTGTLPSGGLLTFRIIVTNTIPGTNVLIASAGTDVPETMLTDNILTNLTVAASVPLLSLSDVTVTERATATNAVFQVTLANASSRKVTVRYATGAGPTNGTATPRLDFVPVSGLLTFLPGETMKPVTVRVLPDRLNEADETFTLNLSGPVNAVLADAQGIGTILDEDPLPALTLNNATRLEGNAGAAAMVFTVRLAPISGRTVFVPFATASGSALQDEDFVGTNGTLTFPPGVTVRTIAVSIRGDLLSETNETFFLNLGSPTNATLARAQGLGTIANNDPVPQVSISDATVTEGDAGMADATFSVRLNRPSGAMVQVTFATAFGMAGAADLVATNGVVTFAPGETNQSLVIPVLGDTLCESNETFRVLLSAPLRAVLADAIGVGTIVDNDPLPQITLSDAIVTQRPDALTNAVFTVLLSAPSGRTVTVRYATSNGTAQATSDYTTRSGLLTFPPGLTNQSFFVPVARALAGEVIEEFYVNLTSPVNATVPQPVGRGTILAAP